MSEYERRKRIPQYWFNKAADLHGSAGALWYCSHGEREKEAAKALGFPPGYSIGIAANATFPMLCGLSLELIYKAICGAKGLDIPRGHDLKSLANKAGVPLKTDEEGLLQLLTEHIYWFGKYPVPLEKDQDKLESFVDLYHSLFFEEVDADSPRTIRIFQRNDVPLWDSYSDLWRQASSVFATVHRPVE
ncbi:hypothetical protein ACU4GI_38465 [Cupriavidus basilensis]